MSTFGVTDLFGLSAPGTGAVQESSQSKSIEVATMRNALGVTSCVMPKQLITIEVSNKGQGDSGIGSMAAAELAAVDTLQVYSRKQTETLSEYPDFDTAAKGYATLGSPSDPTGPAAPTPGTPGAGCPVIGLTSVGIAGTTSFDIEESLEEAPLVLDTDGVFDHQHFFDPTFSFTIKGVGDFPAVLLLGSDGGLPDTVSEFGTGVTMVTSIREEQKHEDPSWEASGMNWPSAA